VAIVFEGESSGFQASVRFERPVEGELQVSDVCEIIFAGLGDDRETVALLEEHLKPIIK